MEIAPTVDGHLRSAHAILGGLEMTAIHVFLPIFPPSSPHLILFLAAICNSPCQHGGKCVAPNTCDCSGTGYTGDTCSICIPPPPPPPPHPTHAFPLSHCNDVKGEVASPAKDMACKVDKGLEFLLDGWKEGGCK